MSVELPGPSGDRPLEELTGSALLAPDGHYLDADPQALDILCVTLDVLRARHVGDFSPDEYRDMATHLWNLWVATGFASGEGGATIVRGDGRQVRVWTRLERQPDGNIRLTLRPVDEPIRQAPATMVQNVLGQWRDLERHLAEAAPDDELREEIESRIAALREKYQRRTDPSR